MAAAILNQAFGAERTGIESIGALQVYESIVILTKGGPGDATRSLSILIVEEGFGSFQIGYAAAISVVMTGIILIITFVQQMLSRRWVKQ